MPTIRIDDQVYEWLRSQAVPFDDTPNSVLRRFADLDIEPISREMKGHTSIAHTVTNKVDSGRSSLMAHQINSDFNKVILDELFDENFDRVGRYTTMYESPDRLVYFRNFSKSGGNLWYRVEKKEWEMLQEDPRETVLIFTNASERIAFVIPVRDIVRQVNISGWDRDYLEVNIDYFNCKWNKFQWILRKYMKKFPTISETHS